MRSLISILDFSVEELDALIATAKDIAAHPEKYRDACAHKKTPYITVSASSLADAIGKSGRMIAAVTDTSFANRIYELYKEIG